MLRIGPCLMSAVAVGTTGFILSRFSYDIIFFVPSVFSNRRLHIPPASLFLRPCSERVYGGRRSFETLLWLFWAGRIFCLQTRVSVLLKRRIVRREGEMHTILQAAQGSSLGRMGCLQSEVLLEPKRTPVESRPSGVGVFQRRPSPHCSRHTSLALRAPPGALGRSASIWGRTSPPPRPPLVFFSLDRIKSRRAQRNRVR